jgi:hypothetical protein
MARRKRCPRCAEKVRKDALVCRYCGYEFVPQPDTASTPAPAGTRAVAPASAGQLPPQQGPVPAPPGAPTLPAAPEAPSAQPTSWQPPAPAAPYAPLADSGERPRRTWVEVIRWILVVLYLAATWPLVISEDTRDDSTFAEALATGMIISVLWLAVLALIWWGVLRLRKRRRTYFRVMVSIPVLITAFVLASISAVGRAANEEEERPDAAADVVSGPGSPDEKLEQRRDAYVAWAEPSFEVVKQYARTTAPLKRLAASKDPSAEEIELWFDQAQSRARQLPALVEQLPNDDPELARVNREWAHAVGLMVSATTDYVQGFAAGGTSRLDRGDRKVVRVDRLMRRAGERSDDLYQDLGGEDALDDRIDWDQYARFLARYRRD